MPKAKDASAEGAGLPTTPQKLHDRILALEAENATLTAALKVFQQDAALHPKADTPFAQPGDPESKS